MSLTPPKVKGIFDHAAKIDSPVAREAYLNEACAASPEVRREVEELLRADEALTRLEAIHPEAAAGARLQHFVGLTIKQAAETQGVSIRTANRNWAFAKAWLFKELGGVDESGAK